MNKQVSKQTATSKPETTDDIAQDSFGKKEKQANKKLVAGGLTAAIMLVLAFIKRKAIGKMFKTIFKKAKNPAQKLEEEIKEKIKLPKPKFTTGPQNPEKYAEEKAQYINEIWDEFINVQTYHKPINKEKNIPGLQALQEYGTREDLLRLPVNYRISEDSDIIKEYAKFVRKVGTPDDAGSLRAKVYNKDYAYTEDAISEIMKTLKKLMVDDAKPDKWKNASYGEYKNFNILSQSTNKDISENAKAIMRRLEKENPWILE